MFVRFCFLMSAMLAVGAAESWQLPHEWRGQTLETTEGNPFVDDQGLRWQFDHVYPDDFADAENYRLMPWVNHQGGQRWFSAQGSEGGQPVFHIEGGQLIVEVRDRKDHARYRKSCALTFIAPKAGVFRFAAMSNVHRWEGGSPVRIYTYRRFTNAAGVDELIPVGAVDIPLDKDHALEAPAMELGNAEAPQIARPRGRLDQGRRQPPPSDGGPLNALLPFRRSGRVLRLAKKRCGNWPSARRLFPKYAFW